MKATASDYSCCKYSIQGTLSCGSSCNPKDSVLPDGYPHKEERAAPYQRPATRESYVNSASAPSASASASAPSAAAPPADPAKAVGGQQVPHGYEPWGLGVEHEFLIGVNGSNDNGHTRTLNSVHVIESMTKMDLHLAFDSVDAALGVKLPRLFERRQTTIVIGDVRDPFVGLIAASSGRAGANQTFDAVSERLSRAPTKHLQAVLAACAPYLTKYMDIFFMAVDYMRQLEFQKNRLINIFQNEFFKDPLVLKTYVHVNAGDTPARLLAGVLCDEPFVARYVKAFSKALLRITDPMVLVYCTAGNFLTGDLWMGSTNKEVVTVTKGSPFVGQPERQVVNTPHMLLFRGIVSLMQQQIKLDHRHDHVEPSIEFDEPYVEVKSLKYDCATVDTIVAELNRRYKTVLKHVRIAEPSATILPHSGYPDIQIDALHTQPTRAYAGSYHFWMTLPYDWAKVRKRDPEEAIEFIERHSAFGFALQWLEPLFLACAGGDVLAIGKGAAAPRAAIRATLNKVGGVGSTDTCGIAKRARQALPPGVPVAVFDSLDAVRAHFSKASSDASEPRTSNPAILYVDEAAATEILVELPDGSVHTLSDCDSVGRTPRPGTLPGQRSDQASDQLSRLPGFAAANDKTRTPHNQLLKAVYNASFTLCDGSDIRVLDMWCEMVRLDLRANWTAHLYRDARTGGKLKLAFYNSASGVVSSTAPIRKNVLGVKKRAPIGFEFRIFDNMPRATVKPLLELCVLIAAACEDKLSRGLPACDNDNRRVQLDPHWSQAVADVMVRGRHALLSGEYREKLYKVLFAADPASSNANVRRLKKKTGSGDTDDAYNLLLGISKKLFDRFKTHPWVTAMASSCETPPVPVDDNSAVWREGFSQLLARDEHLKKKIAILSAECSPGKPSRKKKGEERKSPNDTGFEDAVVRELGPGWRFDAPYIYSYLHGDDQ